MAIPPTGQSLQPSSQTSSQRRARGVIGLTQTQHFTAPVPTQIAVKTQQTTTTFPQTTPLQSASNRGIGGLSQSLPPSALSAQLKQIPSTSTTTTQQANTTAQVTLKGSSKSSSLRGAARFAHFNLPAAQPTSTVPTQPAAQPTKTVPTQPAAQPTKTVPTQAAAQPTSTVPTQTAVKPTSTVPTPTEQSLTKEVEAQKVANINLELRLKSLRQEHIEELDRVKDALTKRDQFIESQKVTITTLEQRIGELNERARGFTNEQQKYEVHLATLGVTFTHGTDPATSVAAASEQLLQLKARASEREQFEEAVKQLTKEKESLRNETQELREKLTSANSSSSTSERLEQENQSLLQQNESLQSELQAAMNLKTAADNQLQKLEAQNKLFKEALANIGIHKDDLDNPDQSEKVKKYVADARSELDFLIPLLEETQVMLFGLENYLAELKITFEKDSANNNLIIGYQRKTDSGTIKYRLPSYPEVTQGQETQELETQGLETQELETQELETQELENQELENQELENQELENQELESQEPDVVTSDRL